MKAMLTQCLSSLLGLVLLINVMSCSRLTGEQLNPGDCVCNTEDAALYSKAGYEHPIKRYMLSNTCAEATGEMETIFGRAWYRFDLEGTLYWTSGEYLVKINPTNGVCAFPLG